MPSDESLETASTSMVGASLIVSICSAIISWYAVSYASDASRQSMAVELLLKLNESTDQFVSLVISGDLNTETLDLALFQWDSTFTLAKDAADSGAIDADLWDAALTRLCKLGKKIDFFIIGGAVRLDSLKGECGLRGKLTDQSSEG